MLTNCIRVVSVTLLLMGLGIFGQPARALQDVLPEYQNTRVTALVEDAETLRLALGAAWDDAQTCRAESLYLRDWTAEHGSDAAEALMKRGAAMYELVKCIDDGTHSVRMSRDSRDAPQLVDDLRFWRNELALAATQVLAYAKDAATLKATLSARLHELAAARQLTMTHIAERPWPDAGREAWRQAGPAVGVRLPVDALPDSSPTWWNTNLSVGPYYIANKLATAGHRFITPEVPIGAWGFNATANGEYDWRKFDGYLRDMKARKLHLLLELPTLHAALTPDEQAAAIKQVYASNWPVMDRYAPALSPALANDPEATLLQRQADGTVLPHGSVQLFNPEVAAQYGRYLKALSAHLKATGSYATIAAIHLERSDWAILPETVDYSRFTRARWQAFLRARYGAIATLNAAAGTQYADFNDAPIPYRTLSPRARTDWEALTEKTPQADANAWGRYLQGKYKTPEAIRAALGDDYRDGYGWRLPIDYPPVLKIDYLHFRRAWVQDYLSIKRQLVAAAFPDKLIITEMRQAGDHDGVAGKGEEKWGGFLSEDHAQWTGVGPANSSRPFMIRSVQPVGFGSRLSDSLESLFRDYLWINFREASNLTRYFYDWVAHGYLDYQFGWQGVTNHWLTNQLLYALGPTVANTAPAPQRIGLLFPRATYDLSDGDNYYGVLGWDWLLQAAKFPYTRVDESAVRAGELPGMGIELLILPEVTAMDHTTASAIAAWVQAGGTLLSSTIPQKNDEYGRPELNSPLEPVLGVTLAGSGSEAITGTPLTVTIPRGFYSGMWAQTTNRIPAFETLSPTTAEVLARYTGGEPAIVSNHHGKGRAITMGYPFGYEMVQAERTSIGFYRTYAYFAREQQLVERTAWLRKFLVETAGIHADYAVDYAEVGRFHGIEAIAPGFHAPKGLQDDPQAPYYLRTYGDPRPEHQMLVAHETPDMALRFFPRERTGVATRYLGISTREVHYLAPRADVQMYLMPHVYRCRINNPNVQAIWDVARNVPVGFTRDAEGVSFSVSLPSGHVMMLAVSETPTVEIFPGAPFPGSTPVAVLARLKQLAGGTRPPAVVNLTPSEIAPWLQGLAAPAETPQIVNISYGQAANAAAAQKLADFLRQRYKLNAVAVAQLTTLDTADPTRPNPLGYDKALIFIGNEWSNNDLALHGGYWGNGYTPHMPFTTTYMWPGEGRAVISLSRKYALLDDNGRQCSYRFHQGFKIRPVEDRFPLYRRKLHIAANGADAMMAVDYLVETL